MTTSMTGARLVVIFLPSLGLPVLLSFTPDCWPYASTARQHLLAECSRWTSHNSDAPSRCHYSHLSQAASRSIHFSKRSRGFEYLYYRNRVQTILEDVDILRSGYTFRHWALKSWERQTDCEGD